MTVLVQIFRYNFPLEGILSDDVDSIQMESNSLLISVRNTELCLLMLVMHSEINILQNSTEF